MTPPERADRSRRCRASPYHSGGGEQLSRAFPPALQPRHEGCTCDCLAARQLSLFQLGERRRSSGGRIDRGSEARSGPRFHYAALPINRRRK
jgi:hypothetical protein